jgi:ankyrin repeat protein
MTESAEWIETPLLCAIKHNNIENVRLLLDAGANPNRVAVGDMIDHAIQRSRRYSMEDELS